MSNAKLNYFTLRYRIYRDTLKQFLQSLMQLLGFLYLVLYMALPVAAFSALVAINTIADLNTELATRVFYQSVYLALLYGWLRLQRPAILATRYQHFINTLPISPWRKNLTSAVLLIVGGNLVLLTPLVICFYLPDWQTFLKSIHFPLFAVQAVVVGILATFQKRVAWFSLAVVPVILGLISTTIGHSYVWSTMLAIIWLLFSIIEVVKPITVRLDIQFGQFKYYPLMRLHAIKLKIGHELLRLAIVAVVLMMTWYGQIQLSATVGLAVQCTINLILALVIASYQFDSKAFYLGHQHYLNSLILSTKSQKLFDAIVPLSASVLISLTLVIWLNFNIASLAIIPLLTALSMWSVMRLGYHFFLPGCAVVAPIILLV